MAAFFLKTYSYWLWLVFILLQLSVADLTLVNMGNTCLYFAGNSAEHFKKCPKLQALKERVEALPAHRQMD